jgi:hypothetical protein
MSAEALPIEGEPDVAIRTHREKENVTVKPLAVMAFLLLPMVSVIVCAHGSAEWRLNLRDGARGMMRVEGDEVVLTKENAVGMVDLVLMQPFEAKAGTVYGFTYEYRTDDASLANLLLLRANHGPDDVFRWHDWVDAYWAWSSQGTIRNCPEGVWDTRYGTYTCEANETLYLHLVLYGNPCTVRIRGLTVQEGAPTGWPGTAMGFPDPRPREEVLAALDAMPSHTAEIRNVDDSSRLFVDGRLTAPIIYKGIGGDSGDDYAHFAADGVGLVTRRVNTGNVIWLGKDQYDFGPVDEAILDTLRRNPNASIIFDLAYRPYRLWGSEHPDEVIRNRDGEKAYGPVAYISQYSSDESVVDAPDSEKWWYPSWNSEEFIRDLEALSAAVAQHLRDTQYGKPVVGFFITAGDDGQLVQHYTDYSQPAHTKFRAFLGSKYGSIETLNHAWNTRYSSFEEIMVPDETAGNSQTFIANFAEADYRYFKWRDTWLLRDRLARALEENIGKPVITASYAAPIRSHFAACSYLDIAGSQPGYAGRRPGYVGIYYPVAASELPGKLAFNELDIRSQVGEGWPATALHYSGVGISHNLEEWIATNRKIGGISLARNFGNWYYDMGAYFDDPGVHEEIAETAKVYRELVARKKLAWRPDVCVVITEEEQGFLSNNDSIQEYDNHNWNPQWEGFETSGVPYERHYLPEILAKEELQNFKVYIFSHNAFISDTDRQKIAQLLKRDGRTLVWLYDTGYFKEGGAAAENITALTGITVATEGKVRKRTFTYVESSPLTKGVLPYCCGSDMYTTIFGSEGPMGYPGIQYFTVEDPQAQAIGVYAEDGAVAAAVKTMPGWTSIYFGAPQSLSNEVMHRIAEQAGAFVAAPAGQQLDMSGEFASIHGLRYADYALRLPPGRSRVVEPFTHAVLADGVREYTLKIEPWKTYWLFFE